ncbi:hypothetical protein AQ611_20830 [Burkholderia singularis]|nr:hypothetical protein AQ611_20830 [Burkholderia sp. Bp7605]
MQGGAVSRDASSSRTSFAVWRGASPCGAASRNASRGRWRPIWPALEAALANAWISACRRQRVNPAARPE